MENGSYGSCESAPAPLAATCMVSNLRIINFTHGQKICTDTSGTHSLGIFVILRSEFSYLRRIEDGWFGVEGCRSGST